MPRQQRMNPLALFLSSNGRIARKPFALAVLLVYVVILASPLLLSIPVTSRFNVVPFVIAQGLIIAAWYTLHAKRLRDSGRGTGAATALAVLYALAVAFLVLLLLALVIGGGSDGQGGALAAILVLLAMGAVFAGMDAMNLFLYLAIVTGVLILLPLAVAMGFSLWLSTRPSALQSP